MKLRRVPALVVLAVVLTACGRWTVQGANGSPCRVERGWRSDQVISACGLPRQTGTQVEVWSFRKSWFKPEACSAPGAIYGDEVVLYDCDRLVRSVEKLPVSGFVGPPSVADLVALLRYRVNRYSAVRELGKMGPAAKAAIPALRAVWEDSNEVTRKAIDVALRSIEEAPKDDRRAQ